MCYKKHNKQNKLYNEKEWTWGYPKLDEYTTIFSNKELPEIKYTTESHLDWIKTSGYFDLYLFFLNI